MTNQKHAPVEFYISISDRVTYNPDIGKFYWKPRLGDDVYNKRWNGRFSGKECGSINPRGYRVIGFCFNDKIRHVPAHRLAWYMTHGVLPSAEIDHINQKRDDNRIENLRDVSSSINKRNRPKYTNNKSGVTGVKWVSRGKKWRAEVKFDKNYHHLGYFKDINEAETVVKEFRAQHGFTEQHGASA
jgi:hypothetical protein